MTPFSENWLDDLSWQILEALQKDARVSFKDLGERIGLTGGAVAERVRKMEEMGIIKGYRAEVDFTRLGLNVIAFIKLSFSSREQQEKGRAFIQARPEVGVVHQILGGDAVMLRGVFSSIPALESFIQELWEYGTVATSIITSSQVQVNSRNRLICPPNRGPIETRDFRYNEPRKEVSNEEIVVYRRPDCPAVEAA